MRYPLEHRANLSEVPPLPCPSLGLKDWLRLAVNLPPAIFFIGCHFARSLLAAPDMIERARQKAVERDWELARAIGWRRPDGGLAELVINPVGLRALALGIRGQVNGRESSMFTLAGKPVEQTDPHWHAHSDFFCFDLPIELTIGLSPGRLELYGATNLCASQVEWERVTDHWLEVAEAGESCLLVLDREQSEWCSPDSQGRLILELRPDEDSLWKTASLP